METVIVAVVVGAFSGLLGSIAGPYLTHRLDRRRREELRREERNRELRRMLETMIRLGRIAHFTTSEIQVTEFLGGNVEQVMHTHDRHVAELEARHPEFDLRPERISDQTLRRLAIAHNAAQAELHLLVGERRGVIGSVGSMRTWPDRANDVRHWVYVLEGAIVRRMDELDW